MQTTLLLLLCLACTGSAESQDPVLSLAKMLQTYSSKAAYNLQAGAGFKQGNPARSPRSLASRRGDVMASLDDSDYATSAGQLDVPRHLNKEALAAFAAAVAMSPLAASAVEAADGNFGGYLAPAAGLAVVAAIIVYFASPPERT
mmetsp:Transcript_31013/g.56352  ORF Transcript_31013/g.56352 Transcript_31013/m.56352 type:complete len:145 (-) Transcript_31013:125-559(-)